MAQRASPRSCSRLPDVIPGQVDVFPAQRRQVGDQVVGDHLSTLAQRLDGAFEVDRVPEHDRRDDEIQPAGAIALVLIRPVTEFAQAVA